MKLLVRLTSLLSILFFSLALFPGCGNSPVDSEKTVFRYNESNGISSLDPAFSNNLENIWGCNQVFDGLLELDSTLKPKGLIAKSWEIDSTGTRYTFHLRNDVYFHNDACFPDSVGRRVVAQDFIYSFNRLLAPETGSPGVWVFDQVDRKKNGGFEAPNDTTLVIHLKQPFPPFLGILAMQYCTVIPREAIEKYGDEFRSHPVGTGPFRFAFWIENVSLVLHKNESFWQKDESGEALPYLDAVKVDFVKDKSVAYLNLLQGKYDFMSGLHPAYKDELLDPMGNLNPAFEDVLRFQKTPFLKTDYLGILVDDSLKLSSESGLKDVRVRQALNYAIDRKEMVRFLRNNSVYPANAGFIPRGLQSFEGEVSYGFDHNPEKAKQLLNEAGFPNGRGLETISIATTSDYVDLCEFIQHQWSLVGVKAKIDVLPTSTHREFVAKSKLLLFRKSWLADYPDAENFLSLFYSENFCPEGPNYTHFSSSRFDSLYEISQSITDEKLRESYYTTMDSLVMSEAPVIPLFYDQVSHFVRKEVKDLETNSINLLDLKRVRK
ncbi:ABC transporter substrate-binding protein [Halocola ammonii]